MDDLTRPYEEADETLIDSIRGHGLMVPLDVIRRGSLKVQILDGQKRLRALRFLDHDNAFCLVHHVAEDNIPAFRLYKNPYKATKTEILKIVKPQETLEQLGKRLCVTYLWLADKIGVSIHTNLSIRNYIALAKTGYPYPEGHEAAAKKMPDQQFKEYLKSCSTS